MSLAPEPLKSHIAEEALGDLVTSKGWNLWIREFVTPAVQHLQNRLISDEALDLTTRVAHQKTLKILKKLISQAHPHNDGKPLTFTVEE